MAARKIFCDPEFVIPICVVWFNIYYPFEVDNGFVEFTIKAIGKTSIVVRINIGWIELQSLCRVRDSEVVFAVKIINITAVLICPNITRISFDRPGIIGQS